MTLPLLAIPYIYLTYFEILYTPVRNVIFFVYLFAGAAIYASVMALARVDRTRLSALLGGSRLPASCPSRDLCRSIGAPSGFIAPLIAAYGCAFVLLWRASDRDCHADSCVAAAILLPAAAVWSRCFRSATPAARVQPGERPMDCRAARSGPRRARTAVLAYAGEPNIELLGRRECLELRARRCLAGKHPSAGEPSAGRRHQRHRSHQLHRTCYGPRTTIIRTSASRTSAGFSIRVLLLFAPTAAFVWALGFGVPVVLASARGLGAVASLPAGDRRRAFLQAYRSVCAIHRSVCTPDRASDALAADGCTNAPGRPGHASCR